MGSIPFIIIAILMLGLLILVHELGHFITGRLLGFKINEFSIGMGPKIFSKEKKGIIYSLRWIPMGGFVAFHGEDEDGEDDPRAMNNMPWYKRAIVMFSGAGFNILFAFVVTAILVCSVGYYAPRIHSVNEKSAIYNVAQPGDVICEVNNKKILSVGQFQEELEKIDGDSPIHLTVLRNGEVIDYETSRYYDETEGRYLIGITQDYSHIDVNFFESFGYSFRYNVWMTKTMYSTLWKLVSGQLENGLKDVTGPISTIGQIGGFVEESANGEMAQSLTLGERITQTIGVIMELLVIISMNLAIMNLLPIPALDGFRLLFALIEGVTKKHIPRKIEGTINAIGLIVLVGLMFALEISKLFMR